MSDTLKAYLVTLIDDLRDLHVDDRLHGAARMLGRPSLAGNLSFRRTFEKFRKENNL